MNALAHTVAAPASTVAKKGQELAGKTALRDDPQDPRVTIIRLQVGACSVADGDGGIHDRPVDSRPIRYREKLLVKERGRTRAATSPQGPHEGQSCRLNLSIDEVRVVLPEHPCPVLGNPIMLGGGQTMLGNGPTLVRGGPRKIHGCLPADHPGHTADCRLPAATRRDGRPRFPRVVRAADDAPPPGSSPLTTVGKAAISSRVTGTRRHLPAGAPELG
jgi:hypothetical protein